MSPAEAIRLRLNDRARIYIEEVLSQGNSLATLLAKRKDIIGGPASTYLPFIPNDEALSAFRRGIFRKDTSQGSPPRGMWVAKPNVDEALNDLLRNFLNRGQGASILFEEYLLRSDDLVQGSIETRTLTFGHEVYHLVTHHDAGNRSLIEATIRRARGWQFLGALSTSLPRDVLVSNVITEQALLEFTERAAAIVVGAYDNEGFILSPDFDNDADSS